MKNLTKIAFPALLFMSGIAYGQTTPANPSTPLSSPSSTVPKTGNPSEDTLIKDKRPAATMDTTNKSSNSTQMGTTGKKPGTTESSDTTSTPRKPQD